jgi:hypothetical protein
LGLCLLVNFHNPRVEWKRIIREFHVSGAEAPAASY